MGDLKHADEGVPKRYSLNSTFINGRIMYLSKTNQNSKCQCLSRRIAHRCTPLSRIRYQVLDIKSQISSLRYQVSDSSIRYKLSDIKYQISSIRYQVSDITYQVSSIGYQVPGFKYQVASITLQVSGYNGKQERASYCYLILFG